nr:insertion element protein [Raoultella sp. NCTC 9187]
MEVPEVKRLKSLEEENARLKKLLAEAMLDKETLQVFFGRLFGSASRRGRAIGTSQYVLGSTSITRATSRN